MNWTPPPNLPLLGPFRCTWTREDEGLPPREDGGCVHCGGQPNAEIHSARRALHVICWDALETLRIIRERGVFEFIEPDSRSEACDDCGHRDRHLPRTGCTWEDSLDGPNRTAYCGCTKKRVVRAVCTLPAWPLPYIRLTVDFAHIAPDAQGPMGERP